MAFRWVSFGVAVLCFLSPSPFLGVRQKPYRLLLSRICAYRGFTYWPAPGTFERPCVRAFDCPAENLGLPTTDFILTRKTLVVLARQASCHHRQLITLPWQPYPKLQSFARTYGYPVEDCTIRNFPLKTQQCQPSTTGLRFPAPSPRRAALLVRKGPNSRPNARNHGLRQSRGTSRQPR